MLEKSAPGAVLGQWLEILRRRYWPGPTFRLRPLYVVDARNQLTALALERRDWQDFYFIDSDQLPDAGLVDRLLEITEMPAYQAKTGGVVVGSYYGRGWPFEVQLFDGDPERDGMRFLAPDRWVPLLMQAKRDYLELKPGRLISVGGGGTGSMLIRRDVLERMQGLKGRGHVWETPAIEPRLLAKLRTQGGPPPSGTWSEDIWFCIEVRRRLGIQVLADTDLRMASGHIWEDIAGPDHYLAAHTVTDRVILDTEALGGRQGQYEVTAANPFHVK